MTKEEILKKHGVSDLWTIPYDQRQILRAMEEYALQSNKEWIEIKEGCGMPENGMCIVSYFNPSDSAEKPYVITLWRSRGKWYYDNSEKEPAEDATLKVTHYQPLPSPPQKVNI